MTALNVRPAGVYVDATFGRGGHAAAILARLDADGRLLAMDRDPAAIKHAQRRFGGDPRVRVRHGGFSEMAEFAAAEGVAGRIDGILMDLGVSSPQLDEVGRGFSFLRDGPLDMRMDTTRGETAAQWLAAAKEDEIVAVLRDYGEEKFARRIARAIVARRAEAPIDTTAQLAAIIAEAVPTREPGKHPATRSFQAIRIHINQELGQLRDCLARVVDLLAPGGRLAIISFHSLEDRMVKRFMRDEARGGDFPPGLPVPASAFKPRLRTVGKAIHPGEAEVERNPRARSAVLRVAERR